jgi:dUTP pyrophosphatase
MTYFGETMIDNPTFRFAIREDLSDQEDKFVPSRGTERATGWDVRAAMKDHQNLVIRAGFYYKIPLGFRVFAPEGWWLELRPRSSTFGKKQLHSLYGVIDEDYEGECLFACQYLPDIRSMGADLTIEFGEAIGQILPVKRQEMQVEKISNEDYQRACQARNAKRGAGGFGSTGK